MKSAGLSCWKCGASLADVLLPFSRLAKCKSCNADLHVCRMCRFYDTSVSNSCTEPVAEKVGDKEHKNFCGYFQPSPAAYRPAGGRQASKDQLDTLFGLPADTSKKPALSPEEESRRRLGELFGLKDDKKS
jgi:hypothetical protein